MNFNFNPTSCINFPNDWKKYKFYNLFTNVKDVSENYEIEIVFSLTKKGIIEKDLQSNFGQMASSYEKYTKVQKDDIVFNPMDLISGWVDLVPREGLVSPAYLTFRPNLSLINPDFAAFIFQSLYTNKMLFNFGKGVASHDGHGRWSISEDVIMKSDIYIPELNEQTKIVNQLKEKINNVNILKSLTSQKTELIHALQTSYIDNLICKMPNEAKEFKKSTLNWIEEIPITWKEKKLKHIGSFYNGLTGKNKENFDKESNFNRKFINFKNVASYLYVDQSNFGDVEIFNGENQKTVLQNDLLFLMSSENYEDIGKSSIQLEELSDVYLNSFCKGFRLTDEEVDPHYLNFQLNSTYLRDEISLEANGFTRINLRLENLENTKILLPTLSEQKEIVKILREKYLTLKNLLNLIEQFSNLLEIYKKSLIQNSIRKPVSRN